MKLTTKSRYAINALAELFIYSSDNPVRLKDISDKQNIELTYLEQIFRKLRLAGIVKSIRGGMVVMFMLLIHPKFQLSK